jgi:hypothetical protein
MTWGLLVVACTIAAVGVLIRLHVLPTGLNPVRDAVSDYGRTAHGRDYRVLVVLLGLAGGFAAIGLMTQTEATGLAWLWVFAVSRIMIAGFMTDLPREPATREGRIHLTLAGAAFAGIAVAATTVRWPGEGAAVAPLGVAVWVTAIATAIALIIPRLRSMVFGLVERAHYAATILWLVAIGLSLSG